MGVNLGVCIVVTYIVRLYADVCVDQDESGVVRVPFPGSLLHYRMMVEKPLFEHFHIEYRSDNAFDWLGNGRTQEELEGTVSDYSPYITAP